MSGASVSLMSDYELQSAVRSIAVAIVKQSKGLGIYNFDYETLSRDVNEAQSVYEIAECYSDASKEVQNAEAKIKAAQTLDLDTNRYELERDAALELKNFWINKMKEVLRNERYQKSYHDGWIIRND
jgi:hypothetical protein